jgi:hypothetical protein
MNAGLLPISFEIGTRNQAGLLFAVSRKYNEPLNKSLLTTPHTDTFG